MKNRLGFFADIPAEEYHAAAREGEYLSSHLLGDFRRAPLLYWMKMAGEIAPADSAALFLGRAAHAYSLEGLAAFDREFSVSDGPVNPKTGEPFGKTTKAYREWAAAQTRPVVSTVEFGFIKKLREGVRRNPAARDILSDGIAEQTVRTVYLAEPCQIRMDWFRAVWNDLPLIADLKTCENLDRFESDARRFGYPNQMAFYREVLKLGSGGVVEARCCFIAIEKREPYRCGVWMLSDAILERCTVENEAAIAELRRCRKTGFWPTRTEDIRIFDI